MKNLKDYSEAFTHGGIFHADDVFSTAFLQILHPDLKVTRGMSVPEGFEGLVYDIGGGEFDHHQSDGRVRKNGVRYAAFGLLWEAYGNMILEEADVKIFDETFIQPIDHGDNTGAKNAMADAISEFNPNWQEKGTIDYDTRFFEAVAFAKDILERTFKNMKALREATNQILPMIEASCGQILILEKYLPWSEAVKNTDLLYVIFPSERGGFNIQTVKKDDGSNDEKLRFPASWRGKRDEELRAIVGVPSIRFCHNSGFLCVTDTLEDAKKVAEIAKNQ